MECILSCMQVYVFTSDVTETHNACGLPTGIVKVTERLTVADYFMLYLY
jgi:hypothetical protein